MKHELQNIISGKGQVKYGANIQAVANYLKNGERTSALAEKGIHFKKQEESLIAQFASENSLWNNDVNVELFVSNGAEQFVYLKNERTVTGNAPKNHQTLKNEDIIVYRFLV